MAKFVSQKNPVSSSTLKRKAVGSVIIRHGGREEVKFTRMAGGWRRERTDVSESPSVVSSNTVADECNSAVGCESSWARIY